jgi:hypothetical protein
MAFVGVVVEVMLVKFMVGTAYGGGERADYPNLAGKAKSVFGNPS